MLPPGAGPGLFVVRAAEHPPGPHAAASILRAGRPVGGPARRAFSFARAFLDGWRWLG